MRATAGRIACVIMLSASWLLAFWLFRDTYLSILETWRTNSTFSYGWLIVPICAWLAWHLRHSLGATAFTPSWAGAVLVTCCLLLWIAASGSGVAGAEQFAVVALLPSLFMAMLGWQAAKAWVFPLGFLLFGVPIGHALVPMLMQVTADVATWALLLTGIPVARSYMYISIPAGDFEVAKACSGLNYLITGFVLGVLYSYLTYRSWIKRLLGALAFIVVPILANGVRVYITILVSHLTDMRFGPGDEHVWFGRVFFILVVVLMFVIGRRWQDGDMQLADGSRTVDSGQPTALTSWLAGVMSIVILIATPPYLQATIDAVESRLARESSRLELPGAGSGWQGPRQDVPAWRPLYQGARVERSGSYRDEEDGQVDAFVGVYGIGVSGDTEMISYGNRIMRSEHESLAVQRLRTVPVPDGTALTVREQIVRGSSGRYRVWHWFVVGDRVVHDRYVVKALEAISFITRGAVTERIVTLATPVDGNDEQRLQSFVAAHARCVRGGFAFEDCEE